MKTRLSAALALLALLSTLTPQLSTGFAQGTAFTYQGRLDSGGAPVSGNAEFQATLWSALSGGTQVAANNPAAVTVPVTNGLFVLPLDFGANFPGADRWLQLEVRTTIGPFTTLSPRQRLTATPYAITAGSVTGVIPSGGLQGTYSGTLNLNSPANRFSGSGSGLTSLNASQLTSGTVPDARLSANVALLSNGAEFGGALSAAGDLKGLRLNIGMGHVLGGQLSAIGGGEGNQVHAPRTMIGGGLSNRIALNSQYSIIAGGEKNDIGASAPYGAIGGGFNNNIAAGSPSSIIAGGQRNDIDTNSSFSAIGGGDANWIHAGSGGSTIAGGQLNSIPADSEYSTIGGGSENTASGLYATAGGGAGNTASGNFATVGGGTSNTASGGAATVGGGSVNTASRSAATVGGGSGNTASGDAATVGGGGINTASGDHSTVPGGVRNTAGGERSFAAGYRAKANHDGSFIWCDGLNQNGATHGNNVFVVRASGGARFYSSGGSTGVNLPAGGGAWNTLSDRASKTNLAPVDPRQVLEKLATLPIQRWTYIAQGEHAPHLGPVAQDFYAAFGLGDSERHISTVDADGVALAAIQGLNLKLTEELKQKATEITELRERLQRLEQLINTTSGGAK